MFWRAKRSTDHVELKDRRFEFKDEKTHKFWAIHVDGLTLRTEWGGIGKRVTSTSDSYPDQATLLEHYRKKLLEKTAKKYQETDFDGNMLGTPSDAFKTKPRVVPLRTAGASGPPAARAAKPGQTRSGTAWTTDEVELVSSRFQAGVTATDIAKEVERSILAVEMRLFGIGLLKDDPRAKK